jgi:hypothetical protein
MVLLLAGSLSTSFGQSNRSICVEDDDRLKLSTRISFNRGFISPSRIALSLRGELLIEDHMKVAHGSTGSIACIKPEQKKKARLRKPRP